MPAYNLANGFEKACRAASNILWRLCSEPDDASGRLNLAVRNRPTRRPYVRRPRNTARMPLSGPEILDLVEEIYVGTKAAVDTEQQLKECNRQLCIKQTSEDNASTEMALLTPALRLEFAGYFASLENTLAEAETEKSQCLAERSRLTTQLAEQKAHVWGRWLKWSEHTREYLVNCLSVGFSEPWSFKEGACAALHEVLVSIKLNEARKATLRALRLKKASVSCSRWRAEREDSNGAGILPDSVSKNLGMIRTKGFAKDMEQIQAEIVLLEIETATRSTVIDARTFQVVDLLFRPQLHAAGRQRPEGIAESEREPQQSESFVQNDTIVSPPHVLTEAELLENFRDARRWLEELQEDMAMHKLFEQSEATRARRAILYQGCSLDYFAEEAAKTSQGYEDDLLKAEQELSMAKDDLLAIGANIPPSTPEPQTRPRGGGLGAAQRNSSRGSQSSRNSFQIRAARRRRLNKWNGEASSGSPESRVTKRTGASLSRLESGRSRSSTASPNSYRERKLAEYVAEQEKLRDNELLRSASDL